MPIKASNLNARNAYKDYKETANRIRSRCLNVQSVGAALTEEQMRNTLAQIRTMYTSLDADSNIQGFVKAARADEDDDTYAPKSNHSGIDTAITNMENYLTTNFPPRTIPPADKTEFDNFIADMLTRIT